MMFFFLPLMQKNAYFSGAAGNFICSLDSMSHNAFRTVIEIDTLGTFNVTKVVYEKIMKVRKLPHFCWPKFEIPTNDTYRFLLPLPEKVFLIFGFISFANERIMWQRLYLLGIDKLADPSYGNDYDQWLHFFRYIMKLTPFLPPSRREVASSCTSLPLCIIAVFRSWRMQVQRKPPLVSVQLSRCTCNFKDLGG